MHYKSKKLTQFVFRSQCSLHFLLDIFPKNEFKTGGVGGAEFNLNREFKTNIVKDKLVYKEIENQNYIHLLFNVNQKHEMFNVWKKEQLHNIYWNKN